MKSHKELKQEYKQMKFQIGVFRIRNLKNEKLFIGSGVNLKAKWNSQQFQLNMGSHPNRELQKEWNEYGSENFVFEVIEEIKQTDDTDIDYQKEVKTLEDLYIEKLQPFGENGYHNKIIKSR